MVAGKSPSVPSMKKTATRTNLLIPARLLEPDWRRHFCASRQFLTLLAIFLAVSVQFGRGSDAYDQIWPRLQSAFSSALITVIPVVDFIFACVRLQQNPKASTITTAATAAATAVALASAATQSPICGFHPAAPASLGDVMPHRPCIAVPLLNLKGFHCYHSLHKCAYISTHLYHPFMPPQLGLQRDMDFNSNSRFILVNYPDYQKSVLLVRYLKKVHVFSVTQRPDLQLRFGFCLALDRPIFSP